MQVLSCRNISKSFASGTDQLSVLSEVSLELSAGEVLCVVGPSGCGKTTLLRILAGLDSEYSGDYQNLVSRAEIAYMPQRDALMPWRTVERNVGIGLELAGVSAVDRAARVNAALGEVGLSEFAKSYPAELSGGMRQRAAFARTLVGDAKVFLLDEPLSQLDFVNRRALADRLKHYMQQKEAAAVIVTHSIEEATFLGTKVLVLGGSPAKVRGVFAYDTGGEEQLASLECCRSAGQLFDRVVEVFEAIGE